MLLQSTDCNILGFEVRKKNYLDDMNQYIEIGDGLPVIVKNQLAVKTRSLRGTFKDETVKDRTF